MDRTSALRIKDTRIKRQDNAITYENFRRNLQFSSGNNNKTSSPVTVSESVDSVGLDASKASNSTSDETTENHQPTNQADKSQQIEVLDQTSISRENVQPVENSTKLNGTSLPTSEELKQDVDNNETEVGVLDLGTTTVFTNSSNDDDQLHDVPSKSKNGKENGSNTKKKKSKKSHDALDNNISENMNPNSTTVGSAQTPNQEDNVTDVKDETILEDPDLDTNSIENSNTNKSNIQDDLDPPSGLPSNDDNFPSLETPGSFENDDVGTGEARVEGSSVHRPDSDDDVQKAEEAQHGASDEFGDDLNNVSDKEKNGDPNDMESASNLSDSKATEGMIVENFEDKSTNGIMSSKNGADILGGENLEQDSSSNNSDLIHELVIEERILKIAISVAVFISVIMMIITAWQMSDNPDGIYASLCRIIINVIGSIWTVLCRPCQRSNIGGGVGNGVHHRQYGQIPLSIKEYGYNDPALEIS